MGTIEIPFNNNKDDDSDDDFYGDDNQDNDADDGGSAVGGGLPLHIPLRPMCLHTGLVRHSGRPAVHTVHQ